MSLLLRVPSAKFPAMLARKQAFRFPGECSTQSSRTLSARVDIFNRKNFSVHQRGRYATEFWLAQPEPIRVHLSFRIGPEISGCNVNTRFLHSSGPSGEKASSKIEETVKRLKEKQEASKSESPKAVVEPSAEIKTVIGAKKTIWEKFVHECKHYYSGFKLLFLNVRVSSAIIWKILQGQQLTRRESKQLVRTTSDLFRLVPFSVFVIVPFMELLLPVALKLFPGMLPSTFTTKSEREAKMKRTLIAKLEYAKFLQKTLDEMAPKGKGRDSKSASDFVNFYQKMKTQGTGIVNNEEILKFSKLFEDDITLDNMTRGQLSAICRLLELTPIGTSSFLKLQIEMRLRHLKTDDKVIIKEGLNNLTVQELQVACKERGMRALGISEAALRRQMQEWLDLSQNAKVPPSLLLLSRTLYLSDTVQSTEQLAATISTLPESAASAAKVQIGEREGKVRNIEKLELIKEEQRKIKEEAAEQKKLAEAKKKTEMATAAAAIKATIMSEAAKPVDPVVIDSMTAATPPPPSTSTLMKESTGSLRKATVTSDGSLKEELVDRAPVLIDKAEVMQESLKTDEAAKASKDFHPDDISDLKSAIDSLGGKSQSKHIKHLKKELEDYEEDLKDLDQVKEAVQRLDLKETKGAKLLYNRVNKMLNKVDGLVASLEQKEKEIAEIRTREGRTEAEQERDAENLVTVQELIDAVTKLQKTPDSSRLEQIAEVLSLMDVDEDGVINLDHVHRVVELLGTEHVRIPAKQIRQIIEMLAKEEMLEVERKIEHILGQSAPVEPGKPAETNSLQDEKSAGQVSKPVSSTNEENFEEEKVSAKSQNNGKQQK